MIQSVLAFIGLMFLVAVLLGVLIFAAWCYAEAAEKGESE